MKHPSFFLTALCLLFSSALFAQLSPGQIYLPNNGIKVMNASGVEKPFAWSGGTNNPQITMGDLNNDGVKDLVIYDKGFGRGVKTFINESKVKGSPKYVFHPEYALNFPSYIANFLRLVDYNRDGIPDLIHAGSSGFTPMRGYYNGQSQLCFESIIFNRDKNGPKYGLYYNLPGSGLVNAYASPADMPGIADIDNDGDIDFLAYDVFSGSFMYYYRNCQVEEHKSTDSIPVCVKDVCWGKVQQGYERPLMLQRSCGTWGTTCKGCEEPSGAKGTHTGNTVCLLDYDGDGDMDVLNGNVSFTDLQLLINGKADLNYPIDTIISQDTLWTSHDGHDLHMNAFAMAFWEDVDNDGDRDVLVSPNADNTENYRCLAYFENTGSDAHPYFTYRMDTLYLQDMIDLGTGASPYFYDYNKDGKPDLFISSEGFYQTNGKLRTKVSYFENTSTTGNPRFDLRTDDFLNIDTLNISGASMAVGDLDGDGKDDLVIGKTDGTVMLFKNNAASGSVTPQWYQPAILRDAASSVIDIKGYAAPLIYDINKDGKNDLVIGTQTGKLVYYKNIGSILGSPNLQKMTDTLGGIKIVEAGNLYTYVKPFIGKIDNTGKDYLLLGSQGGTLYRYDGFATGSITGYTRLDTAYSKIKVDARSAPAVADVDGDGSYDMVVGNILGGVYLYKQYFNVGIDDQRMVNHDVKVYPNPASNMINISWTGTFDNTDVDVSLVSVTGQKIWQSSVARGTNLVQVNTTAIAPGMYYCIVSAAGNQKVTPVSIVK